MIEFLTGILVIVTGVYAWLTYRMAKASEASVEVLQQQYDAAMRPYLTVSLYIRPHTPLLYLRISNTGRSPATNVRLRMDRDFFQFGEKSNPERNLRTARAFQDSFDSFPPGTELNFSLAQGFVIFGNDHDPSVTPHQFTVGSTYEYLGKVVHERHHIDLRPFLRSENERDPVVEELERIRKVLENAR